MTLKSKAASELGRNDSAVVSRIESDQISALFSRARYVYFVNIVNSVITVAFLWRHVSTSVLLTWMLAVIGINAIRYQQLIEYDRDKFKTEHLENWKQASVWGTALSGIVWGVAAIILFPQNSLPHQLFLLVVILGMMAGATTSWYAYISAFRAFFLPITLLTSIRFVMEALAGSENWTVFAVLGAMFLLFSVGMYLFARNSNQLLSRMFITQYEKMESDEKFHSIFELASDCIELISNDGRIIDLNHVGYEWLGYTKAEMQGKNLAEFMTPENAAKFQERRTLIKCRGHATFESDRLRKDGSVMPIEVNTCLLDLDGETIFLGISRDITERKLLEKEIQERQKELAELQNLHVAAQTTAVIAHELRQPLLAIASYSEAALILLNAEHPDYDKVRKALEGSERQAQRAGQSIHDLIESLHMKEFKTEAFDLNKEIIDALDAARSEHELQFQSILQLEEGLPMVLANRTHVHKVLFNLLNNGIEAMEAVGVPLHSMTVTVRTIKVKNVAQVTVKDNGPGFKKEDVQRLFEPFFSTKARGIGMGLAISRSLIESNGGQLWVDPQEGLGATFHLTLPLAA